MVEMFRATRRTKKHEALKKCLSVFKRRSTFTWSELLFLLVRAGLSSIYAERVIKELVARGVIEKEDHTYIVKVELLEKLLEET
jgi:hypothetical protein